MYISLTSFLVRILRLTYIQSGGGLPSASPVTPAISSFPPDLRTLLPPNLPEVPSLPCNPGDFGLPGAVCTLSPGFWYMFSYAMFFIGSPPRRTHQYAISGKQPKFNQSSRRSHICSGRSIALYSGLFLSEKNRLQLHRLRGILTGLRCLNVLVTRTAQ